MKKKKIMASLVLAAMMVGTLGTTAVASDWTPAGTGGVSSVGGRGEGNGTGVVQREKTEHCFLVAVPPSTRRYSFFADPTGQTLDLGVGGTFQFQDEDQDWQNSVNVITQGRRLLSNYIVAYNAGSRSVQLNVSPVVTMRTRAGAVANAHNGNVDQPLLKVGVAAKVVQKVPGSESTYQTVNFGGNPGQENGYDLVGGGAANTGAAADNDWMDYGDFTGYDREFIARWIAASPTTRSLASFIATFPQDAKEVSRDNWQITIPAGTQNDGWLTLTDELTSSGVRYHKYNPITVEQYNAAVDTYVKSDKVNASPISNRATQAITQFAYPAAIFRLYGEANYADDSTWDILDLTADLHLVWEIKDTASVSPEVDQIVMTSMEEGGNKSIPVSLGKGDAAMNAVTSVLWEAPSGFQMELLGNYVEYVSTSGSTGKLVISDAALQTWYNDPTCNPAVLYVTMQKGDREITMSTTVFVY